jgi:hypothetical protein
MRTRKISAFERVHSRGELVVLASCYDQLIEQGVIRDQAELARLGQITRARVTQILT